MKKRRKQSIFPKDGCDSGQKITTLNVDKIWNKIIIIISNNNLSAAKEVCFKCLYITLFYYFSLVKEINEICKVINVSDKLCYCKSTRYRHLQVSYAGLKAKFTNADKNEKNGFP